jgi:hypothetical protein
MSLSINLDIAKRLDITCRRGDTFNLEFVISDADGLPMDIDSPTNYTFNVEVRETDTSAAAIIVTDNAGGNGFTALGYSNGKLIVNASADVMAAAPSGIFVYDLQATKVDDNSVQTWFFGLFKINEDVTV